MKKWKKWKNGRQPRRKKENFDEIDPNLKRKGKKKRKYSKENTWLAGDSACRFKDKGEKRKGSHQQNVEAQ